MSTFTKIFKRSNVFLFLFVISCLLTFYAISIEKPYFILTTVTVKYLALILYYVTMLRPYNLYIVLVLFLFYISSSFFIFNPISIYGILFLMLSRGALVKICLSSFKYRSVNLKTLVFISSLFVLIGFLILSMYYNNSETFYFTALATLLLVVLLSLSFSNLLDTVSKGNLEFFTAISLFVISDTIFGAQRLAEVSSAFLVVASVFYNLAYFLIVKSDFKKNDF